MQFIRFIKGRSTAREVADSYSRYYDLKMNMAKQEGYGGIPARRVLNQQAQVFDSLAVSILRYLNQEKELPEELSDSVSLLFGKDHVWDWHKVIDSLGILAKAISGNPIFESGDSPSGLHLRALHLLLRIQLLCESPSSSY